MTLNQTIQYLQIKKERSHSIDSHIVVESQVSLTVNGEDWLAFMCTPNNLDALAVGFLFNEEVINSFDEIESLRICPNNENVDIWLSHRTEKPQRWNRISGCTGGVTSQNSKNFQEIAQSYRSNNEFHLTKQQIFNLNNQLLHSQELYTISGGIHTSALSDGEIIILGAEDIGRHNTLDKIAGKFLMEQNELPNSVIITTGRISSEMIQKAARIGASVVISRTSPSSLSINMAKEWGITLIGYTRRDSFRIYSHPDRILLNHRTNSFQI